MRQIRGNHIFVQSKHVIPSLGNLILQQSLIPKRILKNPKIQTCPVQQKHTFTIKEQRQNQKTSHSIAARNNQKPKGICRIPIKSHFFSVKQPFSHGFPMVFPWFPMKSHGNALDFRQVWEVRARRQSSSQTLAKTYDAHRWDRFTKNHEIYWDFNGILLGF